MKVYQELARLIVARTNCAQNNNTEWLERHEAAIDDMVKTLMPSGSGFDNGTILSLKHSTPNKLTFLTSFHHMNDAGLYDRWTDHEVIVKGDLAFGFDLKVTGRDRREIKEYIAECFHSALDAEYERTQAHVA